MTTELRQTIRQLLKNPGFTTLAVVVLALGIGANTAVFTLVNAMLLAPIPSHAPRVVGVYSRDTTRPDAYRAFSYDTYQHIRAERSLFEDAMAFTMTTVGETRGDATERVFSAIVSSSYFATLGVRLAAGREFSAEEERPGSQAAAVIVAYGYARKAGFERSESRSAFCSRGQWRKHSPDSSTR